MSSRAPWQVTAHHTLATKFSEKENRCDLPRAKGFESKEEYSIISCSELEQKLRIVLLLEMAKNTQPPTTPKHWLSTSLSKSALS